MRIPDAKLAEVWDRGFTVVESFLDAETLAAAQEALWDIYPRPEAYFADPAAYSKFTRSQFAGLRFFPYNSWALNRVAVYPDLIDAAERFLQTTEIDCYKIELWAQVRRCDRLRPVRTTATMRTTPSSCPGPTS